MRIGDVVEMLLDHGTERFTVIGFDGGEVLVRDSSGREGRFYPGDIQYRIVSRNIKEESKMSNETVFDVKQTRSTVIQNPGAVIDITEEDLMSSSVWRRVKLPSGRIVEATIRKVAPRVAKLSIKDELGVRIFTVVPSTKGTGVYVVEKEVKEYVKDGEKRSAIILSCEGDANALTTAIARRLMEAYGLSFEEEEVDITIF